MDSVANFLLKTNLHLIILVCVVIAISVYVVVIKAFRKDAKINFFPILMPIIIAYLLAYATQEYARNKLMIADVDFFISQMELYAGNQYSKAKLYELNRKLQTFKKKKLEIFFEDETFKETYRAISNVVFEAVFIDHYILSWENELDLIHQTNLAALSRGVRILRIFILTDGVIKDINKSEIAYNMMKKQYEEGINVKYAKQSDLIRSDINYVTYALNNIAFFDQKVLFVSTPTTQNYNLPSHTLILWDKKDIEEKNPLPSLLTSLYVYDFNENSRSHIFSEDFMKN